MTETHVYLHYTQAELDRAYDQRAWVSNADELLVAYAEAGARVRATHHVIDDVPYGPHPDETLAIFPAAQAHAPIHIHVHGGGWRHLTKDDESFLAPAFVDAGVTFIVLNFSTIPHVRMPEMIAQVRRAVVWIAEHAHAYNGDAANMHLSGHSSGAHLAGVLMTTDWSALGAPPDFLKSGLLISGMYDLHPVMLSARRAYVQLEADEIHAYSAIRHLARLHAPIAVAYGSLESPEFKRQAIDFAAAVSAAHKPVTLLEIPGRNHFEILADLGDARSTLFAAARRLITPSTTA